MSEIYSSVSTLDGRSDDGDEERKPLLPAMSEYVRIEAVDKAKGLVGEATEILYVQDSFLARFVRYRSSVLAAFLTILAPTA